MRYTGSVNGRRLKHPVSAAPNKTNDADMRHPEIRNAGLHVSSGSILHKLIRNMAELLYFATRDKEIYQINCLKII